MERRLAVILAADVVGYSRLMGEDEASTRTALKAARNNFIDPKVAGHIGEIFLSHPRLGMSRLPRKCRIGIERVESKIGRPGTATERLDRS